MEKLELKLENVAHYVTVNDFARIAPEAITAQKKLMQHTGPGNDFHGWLELPYQSTTTLATIETLAAEVRNAAEAFLCIGIGGSYLGAQAAITAIYGNFYPGSSHLPKIYFIGQNLSSHYLQNVLANINMQQTWINVISKSGTTTEPGLVFRIIYSQVLKQLDSTTLPSRIILTTDRAKGALRRLAQRNGFRTFVIPDDVGGRFSVLTPVGLLPIAVAGIDLKELFAGARDAAEICQHADFDENPALQYAAIRQLLYRRGKVIELLANFDPRLHYFGEWWKQLFGESEGKDGAGIFPAAVDFTTDLHSLGQLIQSGTRNIFETFLITREEPIRIHIPTLDDDFDGFNYLANQTLAYVNHQAYLGTAAAHREGDCPNLTISVPQLSTYWLGYLFYFFEHAVAISGYLQGVNPFDQPGVEAYKNNMFKLLGKPGVK